MSIRVMNSVWQHSKQKGTALLMLLAIADAANDYGEAFPSIATLATKTRMLPRNAQTLIRRLEESGELTVHERKGMDTPRGATNLYVVNTPERLQKQGVQKSAPLQKSAPVGVQNNVARGANLRHLGVQDSAPNPSVEPYLNRESDPTLSHAAIVAYRERFKLTPNVTQRQQIIDSVSDLNRWQTVLLYWQANEYRPQSIGKMLDRYKEQTNGSGANGHTTDDLVPDADGVYRMPESYYTSRK